MGHSHRQRRCAPGAAEQAFFANLLRQFVHLFHRDRESGGVHLGHGVLGDGCGIGARAFDIHAQVHARLERASCDQGHGGDQRFKAHRPVTNRAGITFARDDLGRGAAGDQRVKTGDRAAGNGDETERKKLACHHQTRSVDEPADGRHFQIRQHEKHAHRQGENGAELHEGAEIIARCQQQPHRQHARRQPIQNNRPRQRLGSQCKGLGPMSVAVHKLAAPNRQQQQHHAHGRRFQHFAHTPPTQITAHEHRNGNGGANRENAPGTLGQRFHHHQRQHRQQYNHDGQNGGQPDVTRQRVEFFLDHLPQRLAIPPHRAKQNDKILHRAAQHHPNQNPEGARQIPELSCQHRPNQGSRTGNGGKVMPKHDPFVRLDEIPAIIMHLAGGRSPVIEQQHPRCDPFGIKAVADGIAAQRGDQNVSGIERLAPVQGQGDVSPGAQECDQHP